MSSRGEIFIVHGDITQITADAIAYSTSIVVSKDIEGKMRLAFDKHLPGVTAHWGERRAKEGKGRRYFDFGESFWIPLESGHAPYGVVVVAAGGRHTPMPAEPPEFLAVIGAVSEAVRNLRELQRELQNDPQQEPKRLLVALPAFRVGTGGSEAEAQEAARNQVKAARQVLNGLPEVDVVFVTYTPRLYQIFLEERRKLGQAPAVPADLLPNELVDALAGGECVLFVGAGLSKAAGMKDFSGLIKVMAEQLGITGDLPKDVDYFLDLAQWYREAFPQEVHQLIQREFGKEVTWAKPTMDHYWLMSLPVHYVVTTNYDALLERSLEAQHRFPITAVRQEDVARTGGREGVHVIKFHGDADQSEDKRDENKRDESKLVLSRDDYDQFFTDRPVMASLLQGLLLNQTFLFVGYSLRDPNFRQIYSGITQMLKEAKRPAFALTFDEVTDHVRRQFDKKQLYLLPMLCPLKEKVHMERCLLDQLAERVVGRALFLAPGVQASNELPVPTTERLGELQSLLYTVGDEVERLGSEKLDVNEAQHVASTLAFLAEQGWRPSARSLAELWLSLAETIGAEGAQRHEGLLRSMMLSALSHADSQKMAHDIRKRLKALFPEEMRNRIP